MSNPQGSENGCMQEIRAEETYARLVPDTAMRVYRVLQQSDIEVYFVGGCIRDLVMGRKSKDWDLCCGAEPEALAGLLKENGIAVDGKWLRYDMTVALSGEEEIEIRSFRKATDPRTGEEERDLWADLRARDFTMNAMAYDLACSRIIDAFGGREDIAARLIRTVEKPEVRFARDPFAILRALRLSVELGFRIEKSTYRAMEALFPQIGNVSAERLAKEIGKMIQYAADRFVE